MLRIRSIEFKKHQILGSLKLDFLLPNGEIADTVILAGENGVGKSVLMTTLYELFSQSTIGSYCGCEAAAEVEVDGIATHLEFYDKTQGRHTYTYVRDGSGMNTIISSAEFRNRYPFGAIYSDVDISFQSGTVNSVTSLVLDSEAESRRSSSDLPTQINQLIVDIQAQDDADLSKAVREASNNTTVGDIRVPQRMPRFTEAFAHVFDGLSYSKVVNENGHKEILFVKNGCEIPIRALSSGEKQIVYRGAFLLRDARALDGALVFIDEPEISLHPSWQAKILDYYKSIFTDEEGIQTSQVFCVTHSPFIIHNDNRHDDKVIVLKRSSNGTIEPIEKPEYYTSGSTAIINDAFSFKGFVSGTPTVYVEGPTDERYFAKTIEAYALTVPFVFKWVGHYDQHGNAVNTGESALKQGANFLVNRGAGSKTVFLFDCDVNNCNEGVQGDVLRIRMPTYDSTKGIKKGIENALVLDNINSDDCYEEKKIDNGYGKVGAKYELRKTFLCDRICDLDNSEAREILVHLKEMIDRLVVFFENGEFR